MNPNRLGVACNVGFAFVEDDADDLSFADELRRRVPGSANATVLVVLASFVDLSFCLLASPSIAACRAVTSLVFRDVPCPNEGDASDCEVDWAAEMRFNSVRSRIVVSSADVNRDREIRIHRHGPVLTNALKSGT